MRILVISDTHGKFTGVDQVLEREPERDLLIHLGDVIRSEDYLEAAAGCPVEIVEGNNDYFLGLPAERVLVIRGHRILLTHGHRFRCSRGPELLLREAIEKNADIVLFGHSHVPSVRTIDGITLANPGSLTYPRQPDRKKTYLILDIDPEGKVTFTPRSL